MRDAMTGDILSAIGATQIRTAYLARLEFQSETAFIWTGAHPIQPTGTGDSLLDGNAFNPLAAGVMVDIGENSFSYNGSEELTIVLAVPTAPSTVIAAASVYPNEYQSRQATIWRALRMPANDPLAPPVWLFRRIRSGAMDKVEIQNDGQSHNFMLTIESHQAQISNATNQSYLDQQRYDPADTSQAHAVSIANGDPGPTKASATPIYGSNGKVDVNGTINQYR